MYDIKRNDLWWNGNWDSDAVLKIDYDFPRGLNEVIIYGIERCCDGGMRIRFSREGSSFKDFSEDNLKETIPEPPTFEELLDKWDDAADGNWTSPDTLVGNPDNVNNDCTSNDPSLTEITGTNYVNGQIREET